MIRLLGFLIGSAVSVCLFLLILGVPDIKLANSVSIEADGIAETAGSVKDEIEAVAAGIMGEVSRQVTADETEGEPASEVATPAGDTMLSEQMTRDEQPQNPQAKAEISDVPQIIELPAEPGTPVAAAQAGQDDLKWHAFWNPFRSRLAAEGFVGRLEKVTGLDYRVVKIGTGVYEVTFAYHDDAERRSKMSLIASATGLDLPDS